MEYTIGMFSDITGLSVDTLRYYEKEKLIFPKRNKVNRRIYDESDVTWIQFIKRLKLTGMPIKKMKKYATLRYQGDNTVQERLGLLYEQLALLIRQKEEVESHIEFLGDKIEIYKDMLEK